MNTDHVRNVVNQYLIMFKVYVQADGTVLVIMGNQRVVLTPDEVRALLDGVLNYAKVFAALNGALETTTLELLEKNSIVNGNVQR